MKNIAIIGSALAGNKGAAAMLESTMQTIGNNKAVHCTLLSLHPKQDDKLNRYKNLTVVKATPLYLALVINPLALLYRYLPFLRRAILKNRHINALVTADVLLDQGGISFVDGREKFLLYNIASILPALLVQTKIVKCAQALGPFQNPLNRFMANLFLPKMAAIISRGSITHGYLMELGLQNVTKGADYAFLLEVTKQERASAAARYDKTFFLNNRVIGIAPSVVMQKNTEAHGKDYAEIIAAFAKYVIAQGYKVILIPHSGRKDAKLSWADKIPVLGEIRASHSNDLFLCRDIFSRVNNKKACLFIDDELTSQELRAIIGECKFFVASRFHAMVSSLAMQVPTLVIGWSHKYKEVLEMFGLEQWAFGQDKLTEQYLWTQFTKLAQEETAIKKQLHKNLPKVKRLACRQVEEIASRVK